MKMKMLKIIIPLVILPLFIFGEGDEKNNGVLNKDATDPFQPGEHLTYKVKYNLYLNVSVGKVKFRISENKNPEHGESCHKIVTKGRTLGFYDPFYKVRDHYETCLDMDRMVPNYFYRDVREGKYEFTDKVYFDHQAKLAKTKEGKEFNIPKKTQDLVSVLYYARTFDFQNASPGDTAMFHTFIDDSTYTVGMKYVGKETIRTKFGKYKCLKIKPILIVGRIFDSKYDMTLWVTDDNNKVPLRIKSGISVGAIRADLVDYKNLKHPFMEEE